jgi:hypothetical protein
MNAIRPTIDLAAGRDNPPRVIRPARVPPDVMASCVAWLGLLVLSSFLWTKIDFATEGTGWLLLPVFGLIAVWVVVLRLRRHEQIVLRQSFGCVTLFLLYFSARLALDSESALDFVGSTLSYTTGIWFGYGLGVVVRVLVESATSCRILGVCWVGAVMFLGINLLNAVQVESGAVTSERVDPVTLNFRSESYQESGALSVVIALCSAAVCARVVRQVGCKESRIVDTTLVGLLLTLCFAIVRLSQLLGSNAGAAAVAPLALLSLAVLLAPLKGYARAPTAANGDRRRRRLRLDILAVAWTFGLLVIVAASTFLAMLWQGVIDSSRYRVFGFGEGMLSNSSLTTRLDIMSSNFAVHLDYAPVFGNFFVDRLTTGLGSYVHNVLAVVPHLGIVGAALFVAMCVAVALQLRDAAFRAVSSESERRFALLSIALVSWMGTYACCTTFFNNVLLWFPLGMFVPAVQLVRPIEGKAQLLERRCECGLPPDS